MAENKGSPGLSKLARVISNRAEKVAGKAERDLVLDFGSINKDMSLLTNKLSPYRYRAVNTMCAGLWEAWRTRFPEVPMEDMREATEVIRIRPNHRRSSRGTAFWLPGCKMRRLLLMW